MAPDFSHNKVIASDLQNCCSDVILQYLSVFLEKGEKITKEGVDKLAPFVYFITQKQLLAIMHPPLILLKTNVMFLRVLHYIMKFIIKKKDFATREC